MGTARWWQGCMALALCASLGCRDSSVVSQPPSRGAGEPQGTPKRPASPGAQAVENRQPTEAPPVPDVPATAEPCTPAAEVLALFDEYQTAFEDADGPRFLSLHTPEERDRQILACMQIIRERFRNRPELESLLKKCHVTDDLLDVAVAQNPADPVESSVAVKTVIPRLVTPERLVTATLQLLKDSGSVMPQLFNLEVHGDSASSTLSLQVQRHSERSQLEFVRDSDGRWLIAREKSILAAAPLLPRGHGVMP
jgi:hypothetical protein